MVVVCNRKRIGKSVMKRDILSLVIAICLRSTRCGPLIIESSIEGGLCWKPLIASGVQTLCSVMPVTAHIVEPVR